MDSINNKVANGGANAQGIYAAGESNQVTSEILNAITASGQTPSASALDQLIAALDRFSTGFAIWCTDSGSGGAYNLAHANNSFTRTAIYTGLTLKFRPASANTIATPNLTYRGVTYAIVGEETALLAGDIDTTRDCEVRFNGTTFVVLQRSIKPQIANIYPPGHIDGMTISWINSSEIQIATGSAFTNSSPAGTYINANLATTLNKNIGATWVAGNGGGRPSTISLNPNTFYRVFIISGSSGTDAGFDTNPTASNLRIAAGASTYPNWRQIGWVLTDASSGIVKFFNHSTDPNYFYYDDNNDPDISSAFAINTRQTITSNRCPPDCYAMVYSKMNYVSSNNNRLFRLMVTSSDVADYAFSDSNITDGSYTGSPFDLESVGTAKVKVNANREYFAKSYGSSSSVPTVTLSTHAYYFYR